MKINYILVFKSIFSIFSKNLTDNFIQPPCAHVIAVEVSKIHPPRLKFSSCKNDARLNSSPSIIYSNASIHSWYIYMHINILGLYIRMCIKIYIYNKTHKYLTPEKKNLTLKILLVCSHQFVSARYKLPIQAILDKRS